MVILFFNAKILTHTIDLV
uniref:Uncharacterized protein n=1 Tax=Rhizophora mucronata TaxID=61149 RepID=A0A2P2QF85_RHIMU